MGELIDLRQLFTLEQQARLLLQELASLGIERENLEVSDLEFAEFFAGVLYEQLDLAELPIEEVSTEGISKAMKGFVSEFPELFSHFFQQFREEGGNDGRDR